MNEYTIDWLEIKEIAGGKKLAEATLAGVGTVTIWKLDKDGKEFPGFDELAPGGKVSGTLWTNPTNNKMTLYPPKPQGAPTRGGGMNVAKAQETKREHIKEAQDRKEESIAFFNAVNSSIAIVAAIYDLKGTPEATVKASLTSWRDYFLKEHQNYKDKPPF